MIIVAPTQETITAEQVHRLVQADKRLLENSDVVRVDGGPTNARGWLRLAKTIDGRDGAVVSFARFDGWKLVRVELSIGGIVIEDEIGHRVAEGLIAWAHEGRVEQLKSIHRSVDEDEKADFVLEGQTSEVSRDGTCYSSVLVSVRVDDDDRFDEVSRGYLDAGCFEHGPRGER